MQCDQIYHQTCEIIEDENFGNLLDTLRDVRVGECQVSLVSTHIYRNYEYLHYLQDRCAVLAGCGWWTWHPDTPGLGHCWLLTSCDLLETCPDCISGPATGVDVDDCV